MSLNKTVLTSAMKNSISNVLETMFFLPVDFDDSISEEELWDTDNDKILAAKLNFSGPLNGHCIFYIPEKFARSVTADFMGKEEKNISNDQAKATLKEMANMITGNTFGLYDPEAVFNLGIPEMLDPDNFHKLSSGSEQRIFVAIDALDNYLAFQMNIRIDD
jgi:CheY-specific phosphatase CheX